MLWLFQCQLGTSAVLAESCTPHFALLPKFHGSLFFSAAQVMTGAVTIYCSLRDAQEFGVFNNVCLLTCLTLGSGLIAITHMPTLAECKHASSKIVVVIYKLFVAQMTLFLRRHIIMLRSGVFAQYLEQPLVQKCNMSASPMYICQEDDLCVFCIRLTTLM